MSFFAVTGAVFIGAAFGYTAQRGAFCLNSGFRDALKGDWTKVKILALGVSLQLLLLPAIFGAGWAEPPLLPLRPLAAVVGGAVFGASMRWAGGCAAGVWYKLGAGDIGALLAILGMALGGTAAASGPLAIFTDQLQNAVPGVLSWTPHPLASIVVGLILCAVLVSLSEVRASSWKKTGIGIGLIAAAAWPVSAVAGRHFGMAILPGTTGILAGLSGSSFPAWDVLLLVGLLAGGWLGARRSGPVFLRAPGAGLRLERFLGGAGLGIGAAIASGCTVGQGLTGLALLAPSSMLVMSAIFGGSAASTLIARRLQRSARASLVPASSR